MQEAEYLVATADCKGVPLLKQDAQKVKAFQTAKKRPGNRRMATVASVYSVDRHQRSAESILDALFRQERQRDEPLSVRPAPKFKHTTAHFPTVLTEPGVDSSGVGNSGDRTVRISGIHAGLGWLGGEVASRRRDEQTLVVVMDGQEALWETSRLHFCDEKTVEILDFLHVAVYIWEAAGIFHQSSEAKETFTRERLARLLGGDVKAVIRGLRRIGLLQKLEGKPASDCARIGLPHEKLTVNPV